MMIIIVMEEEFLNSGVTIHIFYVVFHDMYLKQY